MRPTKHVPKYTGARVGVYDVDVRDVFCVLNLFFLTLSLYTSFILSIFALRPNVPDAIPAGILPGTCTKDVPTFNRSIYI